ncbi:LysR family transcriptional regulator [Paenibacillus hodogayensis]|uniref:LysR family transcriptional regulator n=1 Tax=Paenibacillus hodogayensis TaxID=279208 RepID=A0ABV5W191_9BACL
MNVHAFRLFHEVVINGGVMKASQHLHISQPAVTAQLRNLEKELGLELFRPKGRGLALTEAGERLAGMGGRFFALEREIEREAARIRDGQLGRLRIAATYLPANMLLPSWIASFAGIYPDVDIGLATVNSREAFRRLLHHEADLAVVGGGRELPPGLAHEPLMEDELWFVVPGAHPLAGSETTLAALLVEPFVVREEGSSGRELLLALCRLHGQPLPRIGLQCSGTAETVRAVAAGYGAALVSALEVRENIARGEVGRVRIAGVRVGNPIGLYTREGDALTPCAKQFVRFARSASGLPE